MTRFEFSKSQKAEMFKRSSGICEAGKENTEAFYGMGKGETCFAPAKEFDHVIADALKRERPRSADEGLHVCIKHHKNKTYGNDRPKIAKAKRIEERNAGVIEPKQKFASRPFQPRFKETDHASRLAASNQKHKAIMNQKRGVS